MRRTFISSLVVFLFALFAGGSAVAAPQVLAVLSTGNGAAMMCEGDTCTAALSTYCLQRDRKSPDTGDIYHVADSSRYSLVLDFADGSEKTVPVGDTVTFTTIRNFKSISASIPKSFVEGHGASGIRLVVEAEASLIPEMDPDDPYPMSKGEIAMATGPLRNMGARVLDARDDADTARTLATIIRGATEWDGIAEMEYDALRERVSHVAAAEKIGPEGLMAIGQEFDRCVSVFEAGNTYDVRYCLMQRHDNVMLELNRRYWDVQAGS